MKTIKVKFEGTTALMLNNPQCINPMHPLSKALKAITSKRNKTDEDHMEIIHLQFLASPYLNKKGQYIIPSQMIAKQAAYREANKLVLMRKRYFRYYRLKGWSDEDIERIIRKELEEQSK